MAGPPAPGTGPVGLGKPPLPKAGCAAEVSLEIAFATSSLMAALVLESSSACIADAGGTIGSTIGGNMGGGAGAQSPIAAQPPVTEPKSAGMPAAGSMPGCKPMFACCWMFILTVRIRAINEALGFVLLTSGPLAMQNFWTSMASDLKEAAPDWSILFSAKKRSASLAFGSSAANVCTGAPKRPPPPWRMPRLASRIRETRAPLGFVQARSGPLSNTASAT
mmetsp:Transcript_95877/g.249912  ORF Transcript_95877/g.249912 Transcript_95877/m.249912 type:complete len:221 (-) Transcript_95877:297-959(-)